MVKLLSVYDPKIKGDVKLPRFAKQGQQIKCVLAVPQSVVVCPFDETPQLGRFTLRDEGRSIAIGKVLKLVHKKP